MVSFPIHSFLAFICAGLLIQLCSLPLIVADPTPVDNLYNLVKGKNKGSCDSHIEDLKTAYTDALAMAQAAIDSIDAVKNGRFSNWIKTSKNNRKAKMLQAMFQIRAAGIRHSISSEDSTNLDRVRRVYQSMISNANINFNGLYWLYCGDDYFTHYNPTDEDPSYIGMQNPKPTVAEYTKKCAQSGGWYDGSMNWFASQKANEQRSDVFCRSGTGAFTIASFQSITWCPNAFDGFSNSHKYVADIGAIKKDQKQIKKLDPLKSYESLAAVWVHEWTHLQSGAGDQPAFDGSGNAIANEKAYGFFSCVNLGRKPGAGDQSGKSLAVANADTYAYFAMAMYFEQWDWSDGFAQNAFGM